MAVATRAITMRKDKVLEIAEHLGCNGEELWIEISKLYKPELIEELIEKYAESEEAVIWEFSTSIEKETKELAKQVSMYRKELLGKD